MLIGRLNTLSEHVDKFIVVEGDHQFQNQYKGFVLEENMWALQGFEDKVIYHKVPAILTDDPWKNENHQRRGFEEILNGLSLSDSDLVTVCDVDEWWTIGDIEQTQEVSAMNSMKFNMSLYWYHKHELTGVIGRWGFLKGKDLDFVRRQQRHTFPEVRNSFHYTSMGDYEYLLRKMTGYAHSEFNVPGIEDELLDQWTIGRFYGETFTEVEFDENTPRWVSKFKFPSSWYRKRSDEKV